MPPIQITAVVGLPRSGTTLMMRMLYTGGLPVFADDRVGFENMRTTELPAKRDWVGECVGKAVKVLDPYVHRLPTTFTYRFIWMRRIAREQAKSQIKLIGAMGYAVDSQAWRPMVRSIEKDTKRSLRLLTTEYESTLLVVDFEDLLAEPIHVARRVALFCGGGLDAAAMAACVVPRRPECLPYMLELQQLAAAEGSMP